MNTTTQHSTAGRAAAGRRKRHGGAYVVVLSVSVIVALMGLGSILAGRVRLRTAQMGSEAGDARVAAQAGAEAARLWINHDPDWRKNYPGPKFGADALFKLEDGGTFTVEVQDAADGSLANRPHDTATVTATGVKGGSRQMVQVRLKARPRPLPALAFALHTAGQFRVNTGMSLNAAGSAVSTNYNVRNEGTITGDVEIPASAIETQGTVVGTVRTFSPLKAFPPRSVIEMYAALGTQINPGTEIVGRVFAPRYNVSGGGSNPDGVYVIRTTNDLTIRNTRFHGTLVVICPGRTVTIEGQNLMHKATRPDYPVLIIDGNAVFAYDSATAIQESLLGINLNPDGAPYPGHEPDGLIGDLLDTYPSQIEGLVHVTGTVRFQNSAKIKGALLCESGLAADAVRVEGTNVIEYDRTLLTDPPQGYTEWVKMVVEPNSWRRVVK